MSENLLLIVLLGVLFGFVVSSLVTWIRAERDERRWRRLVKEEHDRALIRRARYGQQDEQQ